MQIATCIGAAAALPFLLLSGSLCLVSCVCVGGRGVDSVPEKERIRNKLKCTASLLPVFPGFFRLLLLTRVGRGEEEMSERNSFLSGVWRSGLACVNDFLKWRPGPSLHSKERADLRLLVGGGGGWQPH